ncbi:hypothetical protein P4N68_04260 [Corynebacterium felinum]|uniref:hypothetical protein n=1 Tax=Corynebacterium felinum TaxID=131318 RepID=UPI0023F96272|nr:hypothetical protein [Corynebacterium felinum]MDF5820299.1 hypothetical protein [Corynebacterium felinum]WJY95816.1 hypothetical protein CFELI_11105 [Corynebacterium felinum]
MFEAAFSDADDQGHFSHIRSDTEEYCDAAISTQDGRLSVTYNHSGRDVLGKDVLCRRAFEVLQKLRVKGGYE